ncbi:RNA 2'-phosphotransferase [Brevibacillus ruminantium]|uniref:RNA 2'-phosphotransferase n=1 Tax=Brevibacillus ruminantium TaxID=2950604 RepID=A0ABY4WKG5_9BACL|nr:RNA 2'-phosphotransferase [Brevibacillus ruminantium]USG67641.1 RNA 2'-phosphotransferase [Brevibacillus ruminantium]
MEQDFERARLRKRLLSALRQNTEPLTLFYDTYGYTAVEPLLSYIRTLKGCSLVTREDLRQVVELDPAQQIEWDGGELIRATFGFLPGPKKAGEEVEPPERLYYATHRKLLGQIAEGGLLPIASDLVQLLLTPPDVSERVRTLVLLEVEARKAWELGIRFFYDGGPYYFSEAIPAAYVSEAGLRVRS